MLQGLIGQAEEKLKEAKKEAANIIESAKANEWLEKVNIRLGLIPQKDIGDKRRELIRYYSACEPYLIRISQNNAVKRQKELNALEDERLIKIEEYNEAFNG